MIFDVLDKLDRRLVHALQLDGRVPFRKVADVLAVSDQTIARRYARLRSTGLIRVLGLTDPLRLGEIPWYVRVQCTPDAALPVAEALARRDDTSWVNLIAGGTEVSALVRARDGHDSRALLLQKLPRTPRVVGVTAHFFLHHFFGGALGLINKLGALTPDEVQALTPPAQNGSACELTATDRKMLDVLGRDGRAGVVELAAATGGSQTSVRRRLAELRDSGVLYFDVDLDDHLLAGNVRCALWLVVAPAELAAVGAALAEHPEVAFAAATTGQANLHATIVCRDVTALYTYLTTRIAALPAIQRVETLPIIRTVKGPGNLQMPALGGSMRNETNRIHR